MKPKLLKGDWMITMIAICVLLFLLFLVGKKVGIRNLFEKLAIFWFRLAFSFVLLYIAHIVLDDFGIVIPVNFFSAFTIAILGIPVVLCVGVLTILQ